MPKKRSTRNSNNTSINIRANEVKNRKLNKQENNNV